MPGLGVFKQSFMTDVMDIAEQSSATAWDSSRGDESIHS